MPCSPYSPMILFEFYDEKDSGDEERYDTIGGILAGKLSLGANTTIENIDRLAGMANDILFVVHKMAYRQILPD